MRSSSRIPWTWTIVSALVLTMAAGSAGAAAPVDAECSIRSVDVSGDGEFVAIGWSSNVSLFRKGKHEPMWTYQTTGLVDVVVLSDDGQKLAVAYNDAPWPYVVGSHGHVGFFSDTSSPVMTWNYTTDYPINGLGRRAMDMSRDGSMIVAGTRMIPQHVGTLYRFDTAGPMPPVTYSYPNSIVSVSISGNKEWFAAGSYWWDMRVYNVATGTYCSAGLGDPFYAVALDYDGTYVAAGHGWAGRVDLYDVVSSGVCPQVWSYSTQGTNAAIVMDDAGTSFVVGQHHNPSNDIDGAWLFSTSGPSPLWFHPTDEGMTTVDMTRDGGLMACGGVEGNVDLMDYSGPDPLLTQFIGETVSEVAMSADGSYFAGVSLAGFLYMFESSEDGTSIDGIWKTACETILCHVPLGNPDKHRTLVIGGQAAAAHLMHHPNDYLGMCEN